MTARSADAPRMLTITDGRAVVGFLIRRGKLGFEAFDSEQRSLGTFPSQREATDALAASRKGAR